MQRRHKASKNLDKDAKAAGPFRPDDSRHSSAHTAVTHGSQQSTSQPEKIYQTCEKNAVLQPKQMRKFMNQYLGRGARTAQSSTRKLNMLENEKHANPNGASEDQHAITFAWLLQTTRSTTMRGYIRILLTCWSLLPGKAGSRREKLHTPTAAHNNASTCRQRQVRLPSLIFAIPYTKFHSSLGYTSSIVINTLISSLRIFRDSFVSLSKFINGPMRTSIEKKRGRESMCMCICPVCMCMYAFRIGVFLCQDWFFA